MRFIPVAICLLLIITACKDTSASPPTPGPCRLPAAHSPRIKHSMLTTGQASLDNYPPPNPRLGRACRSDYFVIDVPVALPGIDNLCSNLGARLDLWLADNGGAIGKTWTSQSLTSEMLSIRPDGSRDQHCLLNFNGSGGVLVPIPPQAQCDAIATIRAALVAVVGPNQAATLLVARECDARTQSETLWHKAALDLPDDVATGGDGVTIAVIDTPIDPTVFTPTECGSARDTSSEPARHGAAIGALLRTIAPEADLKFYVGLSEAIGGAVTDVTMAVHRAIDDHGSDPLVINMSLGWPPEMGQMSRLTGKKLTQHSRQYLGLGPQANRCRIIEDPVGESTRRALLRAQDENIIVLAAAGNRRESTVAPAHLAPPAALVNRVHQGRLPYCGATTKSAGINHAATFFPAAWGEPITCLDPATSRYETLLLGVDQFSQRASPARDQNPRALLRAPGHRIRVDYTTTSGVDMTWVINGTSAATAIASGIAARLLSSETKEHDSEELRNLVLSHANPDSRSPNSVWLAAVSPTSFEDLAATETDPVCLPSGRTPRESSVSLGTSFTDTTGTSVWPDAYGQGTATPQPVIGCGEDCFGLMESLDPGALGTVTVKTSVLDHLQGDLKLILSDGVSEWSLPLGDKTSLKAYTGSLAKIGFELPSTLSGDKLDFWLSGYFDDGKSSAYYTDALPVYLDP